MILFKRCSSTPWFVVIRHPSCNSSGACTGFMAGTVSPFSPQATVSTITELPQSNSVAAQLNRIGPPFFPRFPTKNSGVSACSDRNPASEIAVSEGPSCIFVGPLETASRETLEALYRQARDSYYSGRPLIVDDMFDRVELKLRSYGSKSVVKYPRCSLRRQLTYADAEEDPSQVLALASVWALLLAFGSFTFLIPTIYTIGLAYRDAINSRLFYNSTASALEFLAMVKGVLFVALGSMIGYPFASASVGALKGLWRNDLVALKGACPNCGEEVFAFVRTDKPNHAPHRTDCHVCECSLEFHSKVEHSISGPSRRWVYGRIYLVQRRGSRLGRWM